MTWRAKHTQRGITAHFPGCRFYAEGDPALEGEALRRVREPRSGYIEVERGRPVYLWVCTRCLTTVARLAEVRGVEFGEVTP